ncbi:ABC transporter ATP-binding protein [Bacillus luteolus]|uniref:ABC transporter ATP-binding protein n=1 Tax=Litchfieldia luteola TaxID=682179 RepID=A0ABR9QNY9_9BACI|nr:ABC transporter ATP-binding protein [Cytobacillus luteolus]MBE4910225.1 ABC transporter ATP-binding protein [Cytobacillus luteolus]MBP1942205.1 oligopeptide transport system ATP-binding protein [Cytobacillus luteolus]
MGNILEVNDLHVTFDTYAGVVKAVRGVSFHVKPGEAVAIVGESGCGKSVTAKSIMRLLPEPHSKIKSGTILLNNSNLVDKREREMQKIRGNEIGMIFQDPMTSLNPTSKVGAQITEGLLKHQNISRKEAYQTAVNMLEMVGIPNPEKRFNQYPHEFSGGMRQRVMIAMALVCQPKLLIADEPTTALDVTIQAQILKLMKDLQEKTNTSIILITHDLGVVAEMCDRVVVMYAGQVVESGTIHEIFSNPSHPYTEGLLKSMPRIDMSRDVKLSPIPGTPPDLLAPPKGCAFYARCDKAMRVCKENPPLYEKVGDSRYAACWLHHPLAKNTQTTS